MPLYESVIICRQDITKNQSDTIISEFKKIIENEKGKILAEEYWGLKNLAYEINKNKKAHYTLLIIETLPDKIKEYERKLRLHEDVIRFMTIKIKTFDGRQSIMVQSNNDGN
ncbi:30S ribosomal protein S6 [Alphaproteobacteria bacterium]|nr:30S ribosomal protein S6 [Alphaproteobacteria bacterium]